MQINKGNNTIKINNPKLKNQMLNISKLMSEGEFDTLVYINYESDKQMYHKLLTFISISQDTLEVSSTTTLQIQDKNAELTIGMDTANDLSSQVCKKMEQSFPNQTSSTTAQPLNIFQNFIYV